MATRWTNFKLDKKIKIFERTASRRRIGLFPWVVVGKSLIYIGVEGELAALTRDSLSLVWRTPLDKMTPVLEWSDDILFTAGVGKDGMFDVKAKKLMWTIDTILGRKRWRDLLVLGVERGFRLVDPFTGRPRGSISASGPGDSSFILCGDVAVFDEANSGDPVRAVNLTDGRVAWERNLFEEMRSEYGVDHPRPLLALTSGSLEDRFIGTRGSAILAFSAEDGRILWKVDVTVPYYVPLVVEGRIPILALERFVVIDEATGNIVADQKYQKLRGMLYARRGSCYGDTIAFVSESGHVALFDMNDGGLVWTHQYPVRFNSSAVVDGRLLVTGSDGRLWVFSETP